MKATREKRKSFRKRGQFHVKVWFPDGGRWEMHTTRDHDTQGFYSNVIDLIGHLHLLIGDEKVGNGNQVSEGTSGSLRSAAQE